MNWLDIQAIAEMVQDKADSSQFRVAFRGQHPVKILAVQPRFFRKASHSMTTTQSFTLEEFLKLSETKLVSEFINGWI